MNPRGSGATVAGGRSSLFRRRTVGSEDPEDCPSRKGGPALHESRDALRIAACPSQLPAVEARPNGKRSAPNVATEGDSATRFPTNTVHDAVLL